MVFMISILLLWLEKLVFVPSLWPVNKYQEKLLIFTYLYQQLKLTHLPDVCLVSHLSLFVLHFVKYCVICRISFLQKIEFISVIYLQVLPYIPVCDQREKLLPHFATNKAPRNLIKPPDVPAVLSVLGKARLCIFKDRESFWRCCQKWKLSSAMRERQVFAVPPRLPLFAWKTPKPSL